jgi:hypothetical protein
MEMNAKQRNESYTLLFNNGLDVLLWGYQEMERQIDEFNEERRRPIRKILDVVSECSCGCGLKNAVCDACLDAIRMKNEKLPF